MPNIFSLPEWPLPAARLYEEYAVPLSQALARHFGCADPDSIYDAALGAILDVALKLDTLDDNEDLWGLLYVVALRKLQGIFRSDRARRLREQKKAAELVAQEQSAMRNHGNDASYAELLDHVFAQIPKNEDECKVLENWGRGTDELAQVLGCDGLSKEERRKKVKPIRERLRRRLERFLDGRVLPDDD